MLEKRLAVDLDHRLGPDVRERAHALAAPPGQNHRLRRTLQGLVWLLELNSHNKSNPPIPPVSNHPAGLERKENLESGIPGRNPKVCSLTWSTISHEMEPP